MSAVPKEGWKSPRDSFTKLVVYFKDRNTRTFYSWDWEHRFSKTRDGTIGIQRFQEMVVKFGTKAGVSIIYDVSNNYKIMAFYEGKKAEKP